MVITDEVIESFIECKYKAYLKFNGKPDDKTEFECLQYEILESCKAKFYDNLRAKIDERQILQDFDFGKKTQVKVTTFVIAPFFRSTEYAIKFDAFEIAPNKSSSRKPLYTPLLISPHETVSKIEKLTLCLKCLVAFQLTKITPEFGKIIYGRELKTTKFNLTPYSKEAKKLLEELIEIINSKQPPSFYENNHCNICEFQQACRERLIEKDDLSLLGRISQKEVVKQNNKGIFTIQQLSYTFKPRKRKKTGKNQRFLWELKALALRENQTYILEIPKIPEPTTEIFLDIEGLPEENFNYLIGLVIREGKTEKRLSFWANSKQDEQKIFEQLFTTLSKINDFTIYHYGNYEIRALKKINKQSENEDEINCIIEKSVNLLALFHNNVYPPSYGNGLKEVAELLGFEWSDPHASGIQSIVWRKRWELFGNSEYKRKLLQYNIEDCLALQLIKDWLVSIANKIKNNDEEGDFVRVENLKRQNLYNFGRTDYQIKDFDVITKYAYFDYQREKIYLKTDKNVRKAAKKKIKSLKSANRINKIVEMPFPVTCPVCHFNQFSRHEIKRKTVIDLKFFNGGVKKWIIQYKRGRVKCRYCQNVFTPDEYKRLRKYGRNLKVWTVNQYVAYRTPAEKIVEMLFELFSIRVRIEVVYDFKSEFSKVYKDTFEEIKQTVINGFLIQVDETRVSIQGVTKYVWVFTNIDTVFYVFRSTREADFLQDLLKEFRGVLISDFYSGYDSIPGPQQKCLIHLIRDLNDDLFKNQFDVEYKQIVIAFGKLLRKIVDTIDKYGLKKRHLNKHKKDVARFYKKVIDVEYESELAIKYQKRFQKNRDKLFVFLDYDNVPWNNNNAEHAIKPFTRYRRNADGLFTENSISEYLILFSIQQTCKYRGISFFEFLKSGEKSIEKYSSKF